MVLIMDYHAAIGGGGKKGPLASTIRSEGTHHSPFPWTPLTIVAFSNLTH